MFWRKHCFAILSLRGFWLEAGLLYGFDEEFHKQEQAVFVVNIRTGLTLAEVAFCPHTTQGTLWEVINIHGFPIAA